MNHKIAIEKIIVRADVKAFLAYVQEQGGNPFEVEHEGLNLFSACALAYAPADQKLAMFRLLIDELPGADRELNRLFFLPVRSSVNSDSLGRWVCPFQYAARQLPFAEFERLAIGLRSLGLRYDVAKVAGIKTELESRYRNSALRIKEFVGALV